MTLDEMRACERDFLTPEEVSGVIACKPYSINAQAQADPAKLGFPVTVIGTRVKIPRRAFIRWLMYGNAPILTEGSDG